LIVFIDTKLNNRIFIVHVLADFAWGGAFAKLI